MDLPRECDSFSNVGDAADPAHSALDTESKARVDEGPVLA